MIEVTDVRTSYGDVQALDGLSLAVDRGTTLGVFGTNGAGKTTLFEHLVGLRTPDAGTVRVAGSDPVADRTARGRVRYLPEHAGFPPNLTGREVLTFHARMHEVPSERRGRQVERVLRTVGLADAADRRVGGYSNGMNRRLGLGTTLVGDPAVLVLDEPTAGLDPEGLRAFHEVVESLATETAITIVFSSHALAEIERLCDRAVVMVDGEIATEGPVDELRRAATDRVTARVTMADTEAATAAAGVLCDRADATAVSTAGRTVAFEVPPAAAYDALTAVGDETDIERFEVREPGLEAAFHDAVADRGGEPV